MGHEERPFGAEDRKENSMRKFGTLVASAAVALVGFFASEASAGMTWTAVGAPVQTNSWTQLIQVNSSSNFTSITITVAEISNAFRSVLEFSTNTITNFDVGGWSAGSSSGAINDFNGVSGFSAVTISGSATSQLQFIVHLTSPVGSGVSLHGAGNNGTSANFNIQSTIPIPLPAAAWAGMAMLAGMGVVAVKRRRSRVVLD